MKRASARMDNWVPFRACEIQISNKSLVMTRKEDVQITAGEKTGKRGLLTGE